MWSPVRPLSLEHLQEPFVCVCLRSVGKGSCSCSACCATDMIGASGSVCVLTFFFLGAQPTEMLVDFLTVGLCVV